MIWLPLAKSFNDLSILRLGRWSFPMCVIFTLERLDDQSEPVPGAFPVFHPQECT